MKPLLIFVLLFISGVAFAQEKYFYLNFDVNKPLSNTSWIGNTSTQGARGGYRVFLNPRFSAGVDIGWSVYNEYQPTETIQNGSSALTTDFFKYIYNYSLTASAQYYFPVGDEDRFFPYAGLGLGANYNDYVLYYNIYQDADHGVWGFLARPEAGILVKFGSRRSMGAMAAIHYDYSTNKSAKFEYKNFSSAGFQIGLVFFQF